MKISKTEVEGFSSALRGMRNAMNSWDKSDSKNIYDTVYKRFRYYIGDNDLKLAQNLILGGNEHGKYLRMIQVWADFDMPRYWWSEMDTYHFNSKNSCSTMHKLLNKQSPITLDMFIYCPEDKDIAKIVVNRLNEIRDIFLKVRTQKEKDYCVLRAKRLLMEGFLQLRTVNTNYAEIRNIYFQRRNHRLKEEWIDVFCTWVENLPYANELITIEREND